jgi:hypothetical protein
MKSRRGRLTAYVIMAAGLLSSQIASSPALADSPKLIAGTLTCKGEQAIGLILGSKQALSCTYVPVGAAPRQSYSATITKIGLDIGVKGESTVVWTVLYTTTDVPAGALAGQYVGVSADASLGVGGGANVLVGGSGKSIALQPLSVQGQAGLNLAVGVSGLMLTHYR